MLKFKRMLGLLLTVAMLIGVCPVTVLAETVTTYTGIEVRPQSVSPDVTVGDAVVTLRAASDAEAQNFQSNPDLSLDYTWYYMYRSKSDIPAAEVNDYITYEYGAFFAYIKPITNLSEKFDTAKMYLCVANVSTTQTSTFASDCEVYPLTNTVGKKSSNEIQVYMEVIPDETLSTIEGIAFSCAENGAVSVDAPKGDFTYVYRTIDGNYAPLVYDQPIGHPVGTLSVNKSDYTQLKGIADLNGNPQIILLKVVASEWATSQTVAVYGYGTYILPMSTPYLRVNSLVFGEKPDIIEIGTSTLGIYGWDIAQATCEGWFVDKEGKIPATAEQDAYLIFTVRSYGLFASDIESSDFTLLYDNEAYNASFIEVSQSSAYRVAYYIPSNRISVSLSAIGDGGIVYFPDHPEASSISLQELSTNYYGGTGITIEAYPGYYVKSIKLNGEPWNTSSNPFYDTPTLKQNMSLSNTKNLVRHFTFTPTQNSVLEVEFAAADIVTIEYGDNIPVYADKNNERLWHDGGKYYVSESNRTILCSFYALRDPGYTQSIYYLNTEPDGSGYNLPTTEYLGGNFYWDPTVPELSKYVNGVPEEITVYAILQCDSHWSTEPEPNWEYFDAVAPTCDKQGNVAYRHCPDCDAYQIVSDQNDWDIRYYPEDGSTVYYKRVNRADTVLAAQGHDYSKYTPKDEMTHIATCTRCGGTKTESHKLVDGVCICGEGSYLKGDVSDDGVITDADAVHLLFYTIFPEDYTVNQSADYNGDGVVTDADAVYLLFYTIFPEDYPLN